MGEVEIQLNLLSQTFTEYQRNAEAQHENDRREREAERKTLQLALDEANKKLDALKEAATLREEELLKQNATLTEEVTLLRAQVADLQFQLNQLLGIPKVEININEVPQDPTPSPDL